MDISYLNSKKESLTKQMEGVEEEINKVNGYLDELAKKHIYLQGSLATVSELIDYYNQMMKGGSDESN